MDVKQEKEPLQKNSRENLAGVHVIAVGSGKGGVGKSMVTTGLAFALRDMGYAVGILDADIYGFSIPRLTGVLGKAPDLKDDTFVLPVEKDGVKIISMGSLVDESQALAWKGPILHGMLEQFINNVAWGKLDYLLVDLPPGTGDITISLINLLPSASFILVTTPQAAAYFVAARLGILASKVNMPVLGVIENMAYFQCDNCGEKHFIFGDSGETIKEMASGLGSRVLGRLPVKSALREAADEGKMSEITKSAAGEEFKEIAAKLPELVAEAEKNRAEQKSSCSLETGG